MAAHTYWRINVTANGGGNSVWVYEMGFYDSSGTLLSTGGTPTSDTNQGGFGPTRAFDANFTTQWASDFTVSVPHWIQYQFASAVDVSVVRITASNPGFSPVNFTIDYSDNGSSWTTAATFAGVSWINSLATGYHITWSFAIGAPAGYYANWRVYGNTAPPANYTSAAEVQFREIAGGGTLTNSTIQYALSSTFNTGYEPYQAFDGSTATDWISQISDANAWIGFAFAKPAKIVQIAWTSSSTSHDRNPIDFSVQGSNDGGITWATVQSFTHTWTTNGETQLFGVTGGGGGGTTGGVIGGQPGFSWFGRN